MGTKKVQFDYFKVYGRWFNKEKNVTEEGFFNLVPILQVAESISIPDRTYSVSNDTARLQEVTQINGLWAMYFVRIRKDDTLFITSDDGDLDPLELDEDQGIGEAVSVIYDPTNHVIMIQRNRNSLSPTGISSYLNQVTGDENAHIFFKPIVSPDALQRISEQDLFRGVEITIADLKNASDETKRTLFGISRHAEETESAVNVKITLSLDRKSSRSASISGMFGLLNSLSQDNSVRKMEIRKKDDESTPVEKFDLIKDRLGDYAYFTVNRNEILSHDVVVTKMLALYDKRKEYINEITK
jgi:hypothetical protein